MQLGWVENSGVEHKGIVLWSSKTRYMVKSEEQHAKHNTVKEERRGSPAEVVEGKLWGEAAGTEGDAGEVAAARGEAREEGDDEGTGCGTAASTARHTAAWVGGKAGEEGEERGGGAESGSLDEPIAAAAAAAAADAERES
ncbi:hypothetical protein BHE74_00055608 [Ensete ventricosum]|nr:hypothetical protein BHE74_00055608 [Ensete ventricosum]